MTALTTPITEVYRPDTTTSRIPSPWVWVARAVWLILLVPDLPEPAAAAIIRAMSKKPEMRFASAGEFVAALGG